jgi:DeoR/GlpR family transcriptional regulator of sugar metabolism
MKPADRRRAILLAVDDEGVCAYDELASRLQVSTMTIRRDVDHMASAGQVIKTLGGVQKSAQGDLYETDLRSRFSENKAEKRAIAQQALALLNTRHTVFLDGGTTCLELAKLIPGNRNGLTVITNSALACLEVGRSKDNMTVGIGGHYDSASASFVGPTAEESARKFFVDLAFVSTKGLIAGQGTFESAIATFHIKQIIARQATKVVLLVDHSKFGQRALSKVLDVTQLHAVITDERAPAEDVRELRARGVEVLLAAAGAGAGAALGGADGLPATTRESGTAHAV